VRKRLPVIIAYLALLILALPVPLLHHYRTDRANENMRPSIRNADGSYSRMLMPVHILLLRWLGQLSWTVPVVVLVALALSFRREEFTRFTVICALAICQCALATLYASYATLLLGIEWLHNLA
jgi:hypothetical protein